MKIAVIGKGRVGAVLAPAFHKAGHDVVWGVRDPHDPKYADDTGIALRTTGDAAQWAEVIVGAVMWDGIEAMLRDCGDMAGKILIDCSNPLKMTETGLALSLGFDTSAGEIVQGLTNATVVKTLNQVGSPVMATAHDYAQRPIQFVAGDDAAAKQVVSGLLRDIGFEPVDHGGIESARLLEPLGMIWIDQAYRHGMDMSRAWLLKGPD